MARRRMASPQPRTAPAGGRLARLRVPTSGGHGPSPISQVRGRARQHAAIAALGEAALSGLPPHALMARAVRDLSEALAVELVRVLERDSEDARLAVRASTGWKPVRSGVAAEPDTQAEYTLTTDRAVVVPDMAREARFPIPQIFLQHGVASGMSVVIRGRNGVFGVLCAHALHRRRFGADDVNVLRSAANILGMAIDRDRSESGLRASESRLRAFFDHSPSLINLRAPDGRYLMVNRHYCEVFGVTPEELVGKTSTALYPGEYGAASEEAVARVARNRRPELYEDQTPTPRGPRTFVNTRFPIVDAQGSVAAVGTIAADVTQLREAQTELRHYRDLLQGVTDTIPVTLAYVDSQGLYRWINRRGAERLGRAREHIVGRPLRELVGESYWTGTLGPYVERVLRGETITYDHIRTDPGGSPVQIETHLSPARALDGTVEGLYLLSIDVTERMRTTQALARSVSVLQATLQSTADGIVVVDEKGRVTAWNRQFTQLWNLSEERMRTAEGHEFLAVARARVCDPDGFVSRMRELEANPEADSFDLLELTDGRLIERYSKPQMIGGLPLGRVWSFRDVTERQRAREALQQANDALELRVAQRTSQLAAAHREAETLSYSIAHDLRAPLRAISGYARIVLEDMRADIPGEACKLLERIGLNAERMGGLIDALLSFGQLSRQPFQPRSVDLDRVLDEVLGWMHVDMGDRSVRVRREALGAAVADPALVRIALTNLVSNAIKFSRGRDPAVIEIGRTWLGEETAYYVRDNGAGFDMRYAAKLFGVFQRLHGTSQFEGSGVGLASVQQIVQRHGGRIWAESCEGAGATFYFTLGAG